MDHRRKGAAFGVFYLVWGTVGMAILAGVISSAVKLEVDEFHIGLTRIQTHIKKFKSTSYDIQQVQKKGAQNIVSNTV